MSIVSFRRSDAYPLVVGVPLWLPATCSRPYERNQALYIGVGLPPVCSNHCRPALVMRRQARAALNSRQALAGNAGQHYCQGIAMIRADGSLPVVNRRAIELLGLPADLLANNPKFQDIVRLATGEQ